MSVMKWIEDEVAQAITRGSTELTWETPSGFIVTQRIMKKKTETMQLQLLGLCKLTVATDDTDKVDSTDISAALHNTESCIKAIGALNLATLRCNKLASRL